MNTRQNTIATAVKLYLKKYPNRAAQMDRVTILDKTIFIAVNVDGMAQNVKLIDVDTKKKFGVTNFDGNKLNTGRDIVIDSLKSANVVAENIEMADWLAAEALIPELQGAELRLTQGKNLLIEIPLVDTQNFIDTDFRKLLTPAFLKEQEVFKLELDFPKSVTIPAGGNQCLLLSFRAVEFTFE